MTPEPLGYLVAERRGGEVCLGDEWTTHTTDLGEALATAERWREGGTYDAVVLALVPVDPQTAPAAELSADIQQVAASAEPNVKISVEVERRLALDLASARARVEELEADRPEDLRDQIANAIPVELTATAAVGIGDARRLRIADAILPTVLVRLARARAHRDAETRAAVLAAVADVDRQWCHNLDLCTDGEPAQVAESVMSDLRARLSEVEAERDAAIAGTERVRQRARWAAIYRANGHCRTCSGFENKHLMSCRHYVGPLEHVWEEWQARLNPTFGGTDHYCRCGGSCRVGGMAGAIESGPPVCPNADQTYRGAEGII